MNFTHNDADPSIIIKNYERNGGNYHIEYLDSSTSDYVTYNDEEEEKLINMMMEQAIERQNMMNIEYENSTRLGGFLLAAASSLAIATSVKNEQIPLAVVSMGTLVGGIHTARKHGAILKELKKYKMFLEMIKDNPKRELDSKWLDLVIFDKLYQVPVMNINTLDKFDYYDVKYIYKKFNSERKLTRSK